MTLIPLDSLPAEGQIRILNVADGDTRLACDPNDPKSVDEVKQVIKDMLKRRYTILVEVRQDADTVKLLPVAGFDEAHAAYILRAPEPKRGGRRKATKVPVAAAKATAIAPTAGG